MSSETGGLDNKVINSLDAVLKEVDVFMAHAHMYLAVASAVERFAGKLEGCLCHAEIWKMQACYATKIAAVPRATGFNHCCWKGPNAVWMAASGVDEILDGIKGCNSLDFDAQFRTLLVEQRAQVVAAFDQCKALLIANLMEKFDFWRHIPYKVVGSLWGFVGPFSSGDKSLGKRLLQECIEEYDEAIRNDKPVHRVARLLFSEASCVGRGLRMSLQPGKCILDFAVACFSVLMYAFMSLVERRIESVHAIIKRFGKSCTYVMPPYICASIRHQDHLTLLRQDPGFKACCLRVWRKASLLDVLLKRRIKEEKITALFRGGKINMIYQCDQFSEYFDTTSAKAAQHSWEVAVPELKTSAPKPPEHIHLGVVYLKQLFEDYVVYSMPGLIFNAWLSVGKDWYWNADDGWREPVQDAIAVAKMEATDFDFSEIANACFFRIIDAHPEKRSYVNVVHQAQSRSLVIVKPLSLVTSSAQNRQVVVQESVDSFTLNIQFLLTGFDDLGKHMFCWTLDGYRTTVAARSGHAPMSASISDLVLPPVMGNLSLTELGSASSSDAHSQALLAQLHDMGGLSQYIPLSNLFFLEL